jgi:hypothetical protein
MRQIPNFRYTARGLPQSRHRRLTRVENFGVFSALANFDLLAIDLGSFFYLIYPISAITYAIHARSVTIYAAVFSLRIGTPKAFSNSRASSLLSVLVTTAMFMPWVRVNLSGLSSGNTSCSDSPML